MAEPYDVLASLNRMLESEERREQTRLQSSLALMQFAQQKRLQDIQVLNLNHFLLNLVLMLYICKLLMKMNLRKVLHLCLNN